MPLPSIVAQQLASCNRFRTSLAVGTNFQLQVRTEDAGVDDGRGAQAERLDDVVDHLRCRRRRQREHRRMAERGDCVAEFGKRGTEIVAPLRHAMRLVDHDEVDRDYAIRSRGIPDRSSRSGVVSTNSARRSRMSPSSASCFTRCQRAVDLRRIDAAARPACRFDLSSTRLTATRRRSRRAGAGLATGNTATCRCRSA